MAGNHQLSTTDLPPAFLIERNVKCVTELVSYEFFSLFLLFPSLFKDFSFFFLSYSVQSRRPIVCLCRTTLIYVLHFWRHVLLWSFVSATFSSTTADSEMKYRTSFSMFYSIIQILEEILCVRSNRRLMKFLKFESDLINCLLGNGSFTRATIYLRLGFVESFNCCEDVSIEPVDIQFLFLS